MLYPTTLFGGLEGARQDRVDQVPATLRQLQIGVLDPERGEAQRARPAAPPVLKAAYEHSSERVWSTIRPLCASALGNAEAVNKLSVETCTHLILETETERDSEAATQARRQVGEIRAGLRPQPGPDEAQNPIVKMMLALTGASKALEDELGRSGRGATAGLLGRDVHGPSPVLEGSGEEVERALDGKPGEASATPQGWPSVGAQRGSVANADAFAVPFAAQLGPRAVAIALAPRKAPALAAELALGARTIVVAAGAARPGLPAAFAVVLQAAVRPAHHAARRVEPALPVRRAREPGAAATSAEARRNHQSRNEQGQRAYRHRERGERSHGGEIAAFLGGRKVGSTALQADGAHRVMDRARGRAVIPRATSPGCWERSARGLTSPPRRVRMSRSRHLRSGLPWRVP